MLIYAGIDEAGYSPLLGPLCVACSAFSVEEGDPDAAPCDLWKKLKKAVCRKRTDRRKRIAVDDSKKLKNPNDGATHPLRHLERGVLAFRMAQADCPQCDDELFACLEANAAPAAWYRSSTPLPVAQTLDELRIASARLRRALADQGVQCQAMRCEAIDAASFNQQVQTMNNKLNVNVRAVMRLIDSIWRRWPDDRLHVVVDRQGGRMHYLDDLMTSYPEAAVQVLAEGEKLSRYQLRHNGSCMTLSFVMEAESAHLPVALASMIAKYVRELFMIRLNRYFQAAMPELKPTAGYTKDGRRYLAEIESLIATLQIERGDLIRCM